MLLTGGDHLDQILRLRKSPLGIGQEVDGEIVVWRANEGARRTLPSHLRSEPVVKVSLAGGNIQIAGPIDAVMVTGRVAICIDFGRYHELAPCMIRSVHTGEA